MNSIVYVGMDVHKEIYTVCCYSYERDKAGYKQTLPPDYRLILKYMEKVRTRYEGDAEAVLQDDAEQGDKQEHSGNGNSKGTVGTGYRGRALGHS